MSKNFSRTPPPRQLGSKETLETLSHWQTSCKTFYKRDDIYKRFLKPTIRWNAAEVNYGFTDEAEGDRSGSEIAEDLIDLLNTVLSYLPHSYLTDKIVNTSKCWNDIWSIIYDHYNVQVNGESLLDFETMYKQEDETHRNSINSSCRTLNNIKPLQVSRQKLW